MKTPYSLLFFIITFGFLFNTSLFAQKSTTLISAFEEYTKLPREIAYMHLNKSTYIKGEMIGFSAYVLDKDTKRPSSLTKNLYCTISDQNDKVLKSQLIKVENGFASGSFNLDSLFTSGVYTIKGYTNWMRNFDEQNLFIETIKVIDPEIDKIIAPSILENIIDAQFLPEGGHLLAEVENTIGVIIKNSEGFGVPSISGEVFDSKNNVITSFKTNTLGIGRFQLTPSIKDNYTVTFEHLGKVFKFPISGIKKKGISIAINDLKKQIAVTLKTNSETWSSIKNSTFQLAIHNGVFFKIIDFNFDSQKLTKIIDYKDLGTGINIFTLFDTNNKPILERLFFKHEGINTMGIGNIAVSRSIDSIKIKVPINQFNNSLVSNISMSILPNDSRAYKRHHNIISYTYLQPYVNGYIENAAYYFKDISRKTKFDLDNLLITQGWSSYDWDTIFNNTPTSTFAFEKGINIKANINTKEANKFLLYGLSENNKDLVTLQDGQKEFLKTELYPIDKESIKIIQIKKNGKTDIPNIYLQFDPTKIPDYKTSYETIKPKTKALTEIIDIQSFQKSLTDNVQALDEVLIKANKEKLRAEKLVSKTNGKLHVLTDEDRSKATSLDKYLRGQGLKAKVSNGLISINWFSSIPPPKIYLNDVLLRDYGFLANMDMFTLDYVEINKYDFKPGIQNTQGFVKIYTDQNIPSLGKLENKHMIYDIPITFSSHKKFYVPKYNNYQNSFFKQYGVIGWTPKATIKNNTIVFKIFDTKTEDLKLIIEGMDMEGYIISEEKIITLN